MSRLSNAGLRPRIGLVLFVGAVLVSGLVGFSNLHLQREHLTRLVEDRGNASAEIIRGATRQAMLRNDPGELQRILDTVAANPSIDRIRVYDKQGRIARSTQAGEQGQGVDLTAEQCISCHRSGSPLERLDMRERTRVVERETGGRLLGVIVPILNEPACADCHAHPASKRVLGVLDVQLSLSQVDQDLAASERQMLVGLAIAVVAMLGVAWFSIWRIVLRPIERLKQATARVDAGSPIEHIPVRSGDEIGEMTVAWNAMVDRLGEAHVELERWNRRLETRVEEKTRELEETHRSLVLIEKMASLGKLAAVVAHELNNPLTGIATYARLLRKRLAREGGKDLDETCEAERILDLIETESIRCGAIVSNMLVFGRAAGPLHTETELGPLLERCRMLLAHQAELQDVGLDVDVPSDIASIVCDAAEIRQVAVALMMNAIEASPTGGRVRVLAHGPGQGDAPEVRIEVIDEGPGIPDELRQRVFEPFFTTKQGEHGVGLGLAVAYGIVDRHHGAIEIETRPGRTAFRVRLPLAPPSSADAETPRTVAAAPTG